MADYACLRCGRAVAGWDQLRTVTSPVTPAEAWCKPCYTTFWAPHVSPLHAQLSEADYAVARAVPARAAADTCASCGVDLVLRDRCDDLCVPCAMEGD